MKKRAVSSTSSTRSATIPWQGLSINFAYTGQTSKNATHANTYTGLNGETCYILIADYATSQLDGVPRIAKGTPLTWLHNWLLCHSPGITKRRIYWDGIGAASKKLRPSKRRWMVKHTT
jgi:hypothetical protein